MYAPPSITENLRHGIFQNTDGKHNGEASVRAAAWRKRGLCTVSLFFFLTFANNQISQHNDFNNEKQRDVYKLQRTAASL